MANKINNYITREDLRFLIFIISITLPIIIWGLSLQNQVRANENNIKEFKNYPQEVQDSLSSIDRRLLKVEMSLGIDKVTIEDLEKK